MGTTDLEITESDLDAIAEALGCRFDGPSRRAIQCLDTCDVQAGPGSGKTTALVAKLLLIERQLPLGKGAGVCVLTHTNVGVEVIRQHATRSYKLFEEPNFCGTIQAFVDHFLAIPAYAHSYGKRPVAIDGERYEWRMTKEFRRLPRQEQNAVLPGRPGHWPTFDERLQRCLAIRQAMRNGRNVFTDGQEGRTLAATPTCAMYAVYKKLREAVLQDGILHFDDAYFLAERYLAEFPCVATLLRKRFTYVFMDEMQDTAPHQMRLLDRLFGDGVILQRFGDCNQRIYDSGPSEGGWVPREDAIVLSGSHRLSDAICTVIKHVCHQPHEDLHGHVRSAISPKILLFSDENIGAVLPTFGDLIIRHGLAASKLPFAAVGRVAKSPRSATAHSIISYFPPYRRESNIVRQPSTLDGYLQACKGASPRGFLDTMYAAIQHLTYLADGGPGTPVRWNRLQLARFFAKHHPVEYGAFRAQVLQWCRAFQNGEDCAQPVTDYLRAELLPLLGYNPTRLSPEASEFLEHRGPGGVPLAVAGARPNVFIHSSPSHQPLHIDVSTVHAVKGRTHAATLYLETYFHEDDIWCILPHMLGLNPAHSGTRPWSMLPVAYVALTRPTDLLCIAMHKKTEKHELTSKEKDRMAECGWDVIDVDRWNDPATVPSLEVLEMGSPFPGKAMVEGGMI